MTASAATVTLSIVYTPPNAPANSGTATFTTAITHNAQNCGLLDVPASTTIATEITIPFGGVSSAKILIIKNSMTQDLILKLNGSSIYHLSPGGVFNSAMSVEPLSLPLTAATVTTTATLPALEQISYFVLGD